MSGSPRSSRKRSGGALAAYALGIGGLRYGGGIEAVYYNTLRL